MGDSIVPAGSRPPAGQRRAGTVPVPFLGGYIPAVMLDGDPHVVLKPIADRLGIDWASQRAKLSAAQWACVVLITTQLPGDDQPRQVITVSLETFSIWLAGISETRVADGARDTVVAYKREAGRALREYFFGAPGEQLDEIKAAERYLATLRANKALEAAVAEQSRELEAARPKADRYDAMMDADGLIGMTGLADLLDVHVTTLTEWLVRKDIFRRQVSESGGRRNLPRRRYQDSGHFEVKVERRGFVKFPVAYATSTGLDLILSRWDLPSAA